MNTKFLKRKTNNQEQQINTSNDLKNMINDIADLPGCIEKINQKIQNIEKHISKKTFDTNKVKKVLQQEQNGNNVNDAFILKNIVKASVDNVSDVLNFDKKKQYKHIKQVDSNNHVTTTLKKTDTKKKMIAMNSNKKEGMVKSNKQLEMSSDNLLKMNNNSNSTSKKYSNSQNSFIHCDNNNVVKLNNKYDMKISSNGRYETKINECINSNEQLTNQFQLSNIINTNTNENVQNNKNCNSNHSKNFCFKPKIKKIVSEINDKVNDNDIHNDNKNGVLNTNPNNEIISNSNNNNINNKQNKSFIERTHFKKNTNLKGNAEYNKPNTTHSNHHPPIINTNHSNKNSDLQNSNLKLKTFKLPSKHISNNSIKKDTSLYNKDLPKNINIDDILHFMLFYNEYILSKLPKQTSHNIKEAFINYSNVLSKLISIPRQSHIDLVKESNNIKKILCIQRKWREYKVKKIVKERNSNVECELKEMLLNNFIEKEGFMIRKVIGMVNMSFDTFCQIKNREMFVMKLVKVSNKRMLTDNEKNGLYKEYINNILCEKGINGSERSNIKENGGHDILFNGNEDENTNTNKLLSSVISLQDAPLK